MLMLCYVMLVVVVPVLKSERDYFPKEDVDGSVLNISNNDDHMSFGIE